MERDKKSDILCTRESTILVKTATDKTVYSNAIDTAGNKALAYVVTAKDTDGDAYPLSEYDDVDLIIQDSPDNQTFTDIPAEKQLGSRKLLDMPVGESQTIGAISNEQYIRLKVVGNVATPGNEKIALDLVAIKFPNILPVVDPS